MRSVAVAAMLLAGTVLVACTASPQTTLSPAPSGPQINQATLGASYRVAGGGQFVQGSRDMCDLEPLETILIEDQKSVDAFQGNTSVTSMTLDSGKVTYSTIWPHDVVGTGIKDGSGTYTVRAGSDGAPATIVGHATVIWHDQATNKDSKRTDELSLTITPISRPGYC